MKKMLDAKKKIVVVPTTVKQEERQNESRGVNPPKADKYIAYCSVPSCGQASQE